MSLKSSKSSSLGRKLKRLRVKEIPTDLKNILRREGYQEGYSVGYTAGRDAEMRERFKHFELSGEELIQLEYCLDHTYISHETYPLVHELLRRIRTEITDVQAVR